MCRISCNSYLLDSVGIILMCKRRGGPQEFLSVIKFYSHCSMPRVKVAEQSHWGTCTIWKVRLFEIKNYMCCDVGKESINLLLGWDQLRFNWMHACPKSWTMLVLSRACLSSTCIIIIVPPIITQTQTFLLNCYKTSSKYWLQMINKSFQEWVCVEL